MHGSYKRTIKSSDALILLTIQRVFCKQCHSTHALLPASIVPYSQIPLSTQVQLILLHEKGEPANSFLEANPFIDENNVKAVIRSYVKHWLERLRSFSIPKQPLLELIPSTFAHYSRQFMQIKCTKNSLFLVPT